MEFSPVSMEGFDGREEALSKITRYIHEITPVMFYRTNDLIHSRRVLWHLEEAVPDIMNVYGNRFNVDFARTLALVHDDVEILTGDVQLHDKENMKAEDLEKLAAEESNSIPKMINRYSRTANGFDYGSLLHAAKEKTLIEAQFVSFLDKFDGAGEAWHEIWAGNEYFLLPAGGHDGQKGGYVRRLNDFPEKYPEMKKFFEKYNSYLPKPFDFRAAAKNGKPHTKESLDLESGYEPYERWKKTVIKYEGTELLTRQREFIITEL